MSTREYLHKYWILRKFVPVDLALMVFQKFAPFVPISDATLLHILETAYTDVGHFSVGLRGYFGALVSRDAPYNMTSATSGVVFFNDRNQIQEYIYILDGPVVIHNTPVERAVTNGDVNVNVPRKRVHIGQIVRRNSVLMAANKSRPQIFTPHLAKLQMDSNRVIRDVSEN